MKKITNKESQIIIKKSMLALGLTANMYTNPLIVKQVLKEMELDDFKSKVPTMKKWFNEIQLKPKNLKHLFIDIKNGLINKHPAIIEFLELALKKKWLKKSQTIIKSVHIMFILECITCAMCNNDDFLDEIHTHIKLKEKECGIDSHHLLKAFFNLLHLTHTFFGSIKTLTIDPMMIHLNPIFRDFKLTKKELKKYYKKHKLNYFEYKLLSEKDKIKSFLELGAINIYEAGITDYEKGFKFNALGAEALCEELLKGNIKPKYEMMLIYPIKSKNPFYKKFSKNYSINYPVNEEWQSLYISWNMAFILGNVNNLDVLFPKLLIPSVLSVKCHQFIEPRVISLWLSINNIIFRLKDLKDLKGPKNKEKMANEWGKINKKYAIKLAKRDLHEDSKILKNKFSRMFSHPYYHFFQLLRHFF